MNRKEKWYATLKKKHGFTTDEEVRAYMKELSDKSPRNSGGTAYFATLNKDELREIGKKGAQRRWGNEN